MGIISGTDEVGGALSKTIYSAYKTIKTPSIAMRGSLTYPSRTVSAPSVSRVTNVNFGDININNGMDWSVFKAQVQRAIVEG